MKTAKLYRAEICVYGGTSAGVMAAVQAASMGRHVLIVVPESRLGGLSSGGLGWTDIGNKQAIGGLARKFYERVFEHYSHPSSWGYQSRAGYEAYLGEFIADFVQRYVVARGPVQRAPAGSRSEASPRRLNEGAMWTFEPHVAEQIFERFLAEHGIQVLRNERLDLKAGVRSHDARIDGIVLESGCVVNAAVFIDASYEGDLLACAGVGFRVGREANEQYAETLNGIQSGRANAHQFYPGVDPYVIPQRRESGLLPGIEPGKAGPDGTGDRRMQAYNLRACFTNHPDNRMPFIKPPGYDERDYELLFRDFEAGFALVPWLNAPLPNCKTDTNNWGGQSSDFIGHNYDYAEADYRRREQIRLAHLSYHQGLMWTLANHPRVPKDIRREVSEWGVTRDEFRSSGGWTDQLYVREARRMAGAYVMTEHNCMGRVTAPVPVALGAYNMDSHHVQRHVDANGQVRNEGDVQVPVPAPYPIDYHAIVPRSEECWNLLVPVCLSATHIAYGSIRMEPVFMVLGQSAATAAVHAIEEGASVQRIDPDRLLARLRADGQILQWVAG